MPQLIGAVYEDGVLKPLEKLDLEEHQQVQITIHPPSTVGRVCGGSEENVDPLEGIRVSTGLSDLAEHFDDYRFGRRRP